MDRPVLPCHAAGMEHRHENGSADRRSSTRGWLGKSFAFLLALSMLGIVALALAGTLIVQSRIGQEERSKSPKPVAIDEAAAPGSSQQPEAPAEPKGAFVPPVKRVKPVTPPDTPPSVEASDVPLPDRKP